MWARKIAYGEAQLPESVTVGVPVPLYKRLTYYTDGQNNCKLISTQERLEVKKQHSTDVLPRIIKKTVIAPSGSASSKKLVGAGEQPKPDEVTTVTPVTKGKGKKKSGTGKKRGRPPMKKNAKKAKTDADEPDEGDDPDDDEDDENDEDEDEPESDEDANRDA